MSSAGDGVPRTARQDLLTEPREAGEDGKALAAEAAAEKGVAEAVPSLAWK